MSLLAAGHDPVTELLDDYLCHCDDLGLKDEALRARRVGAERFLGRHPHLEVWWRRPMDARLTDLSRIPMAWPLVGWALLTGRCQADIKKFGHSLARAIEVLYAGDIASLRAASARLGMAEVWTEAIIHSALPPVLAFFGCSPATRDGADLDLIEDGVRDTPMFTVAMRRSRRGHLHGLRRLLYEAGTSTSQPGSNTGRARPVVSDVWRSSVRRSSAGRSFVISSSDRGCCGRRRWRSC